MSGADERGGDQWGGPTEDGDHQLVGETNAGYPDRGRKQLGLNGGVYRLPDAQNDPSGCGNRNLDPESRPVRGLEVSNASDEFVMIAPYVDGLLAVDR
jgi:hypothetical protein